MWEHRLVRMSEDEPFPEVDMIVLRKSWHDGWIFHHLCLPACGGRNQNFTGLPDRRDGNPCDLDGPSIGTEPFLPLDDHCKNFPHRCSILAELGNSFERQELVVGEEQAQTGRSTLAPENVPN